MTPPARVGPATDQQKDRTRRFWNANPCGTSASWREARRIRFEYTDPYLVEYLNDRLLGDKDVLEVGCGQGLDAAEIVRHCRTYAGVDLSGQSLEIAQKEVSHLAPPEASVTFMASDAERLPFAPRTFDVVYSIGVLHHTPGFDRAISEIVRVLKPGGTLIIMLYRSWTPLWAILRIVRGSLRIPWIGTRIRERTIARLRASQAKEDSITGTALLELVGCPIIDTYSAGQLKRRLGREMEFASVQYHRVGIDQLVRVVPAGLRRFWPQRAVHWAEIRGRRWLGFYMMAVVKKVSEAGRTSECTKSPTDRPAN